MSPDALTRLTDALRGCPTFIREVHIQHLSTKEGIQKMTQHTTEDIERRLSNLEEEDRITEENLQHFSDFVEYLQADSNISKGRIIKYLSAIASLYKEENKFLPKDLNLKEAEKNDIRKAVGRIESSDYSEWTKSDFKTFLKKFYRTLYEDEVDRPDRVKKILKSDVIKSRTNKKPKREVKALTASEVLQLSEAAKNKRDRLIPLLLFETGARISEILGLRGYDGIQMKDIEMKQKYADVTVETAKNDGKGPKTLQLVRCVKELQEWLEEHPHNDDPEAHLLISTAGSTQGQKLSEKRFRNILSELQERADLGKSVYPHIFRHSSATYKGTELGWNVPRMMYWHGWTDPSMAEKYCKQNEKRMKAQRLDEEGIKDDEEAKDTALDRKTCGRCGETWPPTQKYCGKCSLALDQQTAQEAKNEPEQAMDKVIDEIRQEAGLTEGDIEELIREKTQELQSEDGRK